MTHCSCTVLSAIRCWLLSWIVFLFPSVSVIMPPVAESREDFGKILTLHRHKCALWCRGFMTCSAAGVWRVLGCCYSKTIFSVEEVNFMCFSMWWQNLFPGPPVRAGTFGRSLHFDVCGTPRTVPKHEQRTVGIQGAPRCFFGSKNFVGVVEHSGLHKPDGSGVKWKLGKWSSGSGKVERRVG